MSKPPDFRWIDPRQLRLSTQRPQGADPGKLQRQIALFGNSTVGMPPPWVEESSDGFLRIIDGVTRATRIALLLPGVKIQVEVTDRTGHRLAGELTVGDRIP